MSCVTVAILGAGAALHPGRNQSSILVDYGGSVALIDVGCSSVNIALRLGYRPGDIDAAILTHSHYDHLCGLPMLSFAKSFSPGPRRLMIAGEGGAVEAATYLARQPSRGRVEFAVKPLSPGDTLELAGGLVIKPFAASHTVPALSYEVEAGGVRVVVSGDTRPTSEFRSRSSGSALAIHEATLPSSSAEDAEATGHSTVSQAISQLSGAEAAVLYHLTPESEREALSAQAQGRILVPTEPLTIKIC